MNSRGTIIKGSREGALEFEGLPPPPPSACNDNTSWLQERKLTIRNNSMSGLQGFPQRRKRQLWILSSRHFLALTLTSRLNKTSWPRTRRLLLRSKKMGMTTARWPAFFVVPVASGLDVKAVENTEKRKKLQGDFLFRHVYFDNNSFLSWWINPNLSK